MRVYHNFFATRILDQRFLKLIRIRQNDTDLTGSGSETLLRTIKLSSNYVSHLSAEILKKGAGG